jgi:hypothetical protein
LRHFFIGAIDLDFIANAQNFAPVKQRLQPFKLHAYEFNDSRIGHGSIFLLQ